MVPAILFYLRYDNSEREHEEYKKSKMYIYVTIIKS